jgi:4-amino-4-deoxy-L-arabinose transferase-like glycosyltransferase
MPASSLTRSAAATGSYRSRAAGLGAARLRGIWHRSSLLPILGAYTLISAVKPHPSGTDEGTYVAYARNLTHGFYAQTHSLNPSAYLWHGPGLPGLLAPLVALHVPLGLMRILVGPVLLFAAFVVFNRLARLYVSAPTALIATYGLALYLPFFTVVGNIFVEPLATLCFTLAVFFMVRSFRGGRRDHLWAGVALAVLALSRVEYGYVLLAALLLSGVWLLVSRRSPMARRGTLATAVALLLCTPWLAYTYSLTSKPFYWGNSGGLSLYWMSAPGNLGDWHSGKEVFALPQLAADRPLFTALERLKPLDQDQRLQHVAFQNIRNDPAHYLANVVNNVDRLVFNSPYSFTNKNSPLSFTREKASSVIYAVPNALLLGLLAIALVVAVRMRRQLRAEVLPIAVLVTLGFAVHVPLAGYARFVTPLVPAAAWLVIAVLARAVAARERA